MFTETYKIWNHNQWQYDPYPTVMSTIHEMHQDGGDSGGRDRERSKLGGQHDGTKQ